MDRGHNVACELAWFTWLQLQEVVQVRVIIVEAEDDANRGSAVAEVHGQRRGLVVPGWFGLDQAEELDEFDVSEGADVC